MRTYRRIEIAAFKKRITIVSGNFDVETAGEAVDIPYQASAEGEPIELASPEGQRIIWDAIRLLEKSLTNKPK